MPCAYCDELDEEVEPEHVFPRSIGGYEFIVPCHRRCNAGANKHIDNELVRCAHVRKARAVAGVLNVRNGQPYRYRFRGETLLMVRIPEDTEVSTENHAELLRLLKTSEIHGVPGGKVNVSVSGDGTPTVELIPNPVLDADGIANVYRSSEQVDWGPTGDAERIHVLSLIRAEALCTHSPDAWNRFTAKVGLAFLYTLERLSKEPNSGISVTDCIESADIEPLRVTLRRMAFGRSSTVLKPEWSGFPGSRAESVHVVSLSGRDSDAVVSIRLFNHLLFSIDIEGISVRCTAEMTVPLRR